MMVKEKRYFIVIPYFCVTLYPVGWLLWVLLALLGFLHLILSPARASAGLGHSCSEELKMSF